MLCCRDNLKRAIALLGIVLVVSSTAQYASLTYILAGSCDNSHQIEQSHRHDKSMAGQCSLDCPCQTEHFLDTTESQNASVGHEKGSSPCPPSCWCHQAPIPMELPKSTIDLSLLVILKLENSSTNSTEKSGSDQFLHAVSVIDLESSALTASQRCVHLCRFLT